MTVWAREVDEEGTAGPEYDDTPDGFGRIAATTAKQVMLQRLRDAEDEIRFGEFSGKEGDIISGVIQQGRNPDDVMVDLGKLEAHPARSASGCRGRSTSTASASSAWSPRSARACAARRSRCRARTRRWSRSSSRSRCPRSPTAPSRSPASPARPVTAPRSRCAPPVPGVNAKGACIGPMGQRVRNVMSELHGEKIDIVDWAEDPAELVAHALSPARVTSVEIVDLAARSARVVVPDFQLSLAIGKEGQNARLAARLTGWRIDIRSDEAPDARALTPPGS